MSYTTFVGSGYNIHEPPGLHFSKHPPLMSFLYFQSPVLLNGKRESDGCCIIYPRDVIHDYTTLEGFCNSFLGFDAPDELMGKLNIPLGCALYPNNCNEINDIIYRICSENSRRLLGCEEKIDSLTLDLLVTILRGIKSSAGQVRDTVQWDRLNAIRDEYLGDILNAPDVNMLIAQSGFSRTQFYRLYSTFFHASPKEDLIWTRLEKAKVLIALDPGMKMYEVATLCGFNNVSHFFRLFKNRYGYTPKDYSFSQRNRKEEH